jgi:hypothetical protein
MKILKKGTPPPPWTKKATCAKKEGGCGTVVMLEEDDVVRCTNQTYAVEWVCPECKTTNVVAINDAFHNRLCDKRRAELKAEEAKKQAEAQAMNRAGSGVDMREVKMHNPTLGNDSIKNEY